MFTQAIQAWRDNSGFGRVQLLKQYFLCVEGGRTVLQIVKVLDEEKPRFCKLLHFYSTCSQHRLVHDLCANFAGFTEPEAWQDVDLGDAPKPAGLQALLQKAAALFQRAQGDPFYAVISYRNFKRMP